MPIAEDVSRSLEPGAYLDSMLVTEPELEDEYRLAVDTTDRQANAAHLLDSCRSGDSEVGKLYTLVDVDPRYYESVKGRKGN